MNNTPYMENMYKPWANWRCEISYNLCEDGQTF